MARLTCSVRVVQLRIESRFWMEKLEDQLMSASGKLQRGMRWPVKVRKGPIMSFDPKGGELTFAAVSMSDRLAEKAVVRRTGPHVCIRERVNFAQHELTGAD